MMRSALPTFVASLILLAAPASNAELIKFSVDLNGANEVPAVVTPGTGSAVVTIDDVLKTMTLDVEFSNLIGTTTASHIHCCTTPTAGVATQVPTFVGFPLGVMAGTYMNTFDMTMASSYNPAFITANGGTTDSAFNALFAGMLAGAAYLNIHSSFAGGGEIRGNLFRIPEPSALALLSIAVAGLGLAGRRKTAA